MLVCAKQESTASGRANHARRSHDSTTGLKSLLALDSMPKSIVRSDKRSLKT
jgi:hypothetical protein